MSNLPVAVSHEVVAVPQETPTALGLFGSSNPVEVVKKATAVADALAAVLEAKKLYVNLKGRKHVLVEGWTLLGTMLGVFPVCVWTKKLDTGWEARVEARTQLGAVVGAAEAQCLDSERNWRGKDDFSLRSMAQTRATSKAMRLPLGFIVSLAGFEATPAEEMIGVVVEEQGTEAQTPVRKTAKATTKQNAAEAEKLQAMMAQLKESDESAYCSSCGKAMIARVDSKGEPYGICSEADIARRSATDEEGRKAATKGHDFRRLRKPKEADAERAGEPTTGSESHPESISEPTPAHASANTPVYDEDDWKAARKAQLMGEIQRSGKPVGEQLTAVSGLPARIDAEWAALNGVAV